MSGRGFVPGQPLRASISGFTDEILRHWTAAGAMLRVFIARARGIGDDESPCGAGDVKKRYGTSM